MILPLPVDSKDFWDRVDELLKTVNKTHKITLDKLLLIFPNIDHYGIEELTRKRGPLVLHGNNTFSNDGVKMTFDLDKIKTPLGPKDFAFFIEGNLNGIYSLKENEFKLTFDKDYTIKMYKPLKAYMKALFIKSGKIFISLEGFLVPDIMIHRPEKQYFD